MLMARGVLRQAQSRSDIKGLDLPLNLFLRLLQQWKVRREGPIILFSVSGTVFRSGTGKFPLTRGRLMLLRRPFLSKYLGQVYLLLLLLTLLLPKRAPLF